MKTAIFLYLYAEPCCALKYYPEIEICVKEQKGEQARKKQPKTSISHMFNSKSWIPTGGQEEGGPAPGGRELRHSPGGEDKDIHVEPHGVSGDVQIRAGGMGNVFWEMHVYVQV